MPGVPCLGRRFSNRRTYAEPIADEFTAAGPESGRLALGGMTGKDAHLAAFAPLSTFAGVLANRFGLPTILSPPKFRPRAA
ncbi:hypothetical protein [Sedimentitalea xiamensis]|nr:hypothetical protein [Sedimentitalea xiamensis]